MIELRCHFCLHEGLCTPYPDPVCIYMSVGVAHYMNMLMDSYLKMEKLFASALLQEAIQTCLLSALLPFPSSSLQNSQALEFVWYKAEEWVLLSTCGLCAAQGVCVCCGRSTSVLFSYCKPKKLFCLRDWMHMYSQLDYFIQIRHQGIPVVNK